MKDRNESRNARELDENELRQAIGGGFFEKFTFTKDEYAAAGVVWEHNFLLPDIFFYMGKQISRSEAAKLAAVQKHFAEVHK